ncbi:polyprenyl synthetase family protein [Amphibacillus cookii]|uniref:polyprenyl synthetase family protein n=1 Tax=Amphibacillus cookii TaxID=767787 RepID=UPI0019582F3E|nr:polyprenyl synthetase family protein [Amphibacillus cookii]MBM7543197.1 heptaprenyl diphosphate synthase [Amphibacillus cookii]
MEIHQMWRDYPELNQDLIKVIKLIEDHIRIKDKRVNETLREVIRAGGKLLRPAYTLLCSQIGTEYDKDKAIAIAAALEALHMATLIHDDVIDQADTRRGNVTLQAKHDNKFAIYAGDYLFSICFSILAKHADSIAQSMYNIRSIEKLLIGELDQLHSRFQPPNSVKSYLSRISGKTAQLFALSCYTGAVESKASKRQVRTAWNMGHYIGMAFQIIDDILDYQGYEEQIGKPVMADVQQGIYTLPLIYAMLAKPDEVSLILAKDKPFSKSDLQKLSNIIEEADGIEKAKKIAERYTNKALRELEKLPNGHYKHHLYHLTSQMLKRTS